MKDILAGQIPAADYAFILNIGMQYPPKISDTELAARELVFLIEFMRKRMRK